MRYRSTGWLALAVGVVAAAVLAACGGDDADAGNGGPPPAGTQVPSVVLAARADLARSLSVQPDAIQIRTIEEQQWSDGCLGLGRPDEGCIAVITPGYRAVFAYNNQTYTYRTDLAMHFRRQP